MTAQKVSAALSVTLTSNFLIAYNTSPGAIVATASGGTGSTYTYSWLSSPNGMNWTPIAGATSNVLTPGNLTSTTVFRVVVSNGGSVSTFMTVSVNPQVFNNITPAAATVYYNTAPGQLSGTVSGGSGGFTYQWQRSPDNTNWTNILNATALTYTPGALTATTYFRLVATNNGLAIPGNVSVVTVLPQLVAGSVSPGSLGVNYGVIPGLLTCTPASGGDGTYTYQWQISLSGDSWTDLSGANSLSYTPPNNPSLGRRYFRVLTGSGPNSAGSNSSVVTWYTQVIPGTVTPASQTSGYYTTPATLSATAPTGGIGTYTYQWQTSTDNSTWTNLTGATSLTYTPKRITTNTYYRLAINSNGAISYTNTAVVYAPVNGGIISSSAAVVNSGGSVTLISVAGASNDNCTTFTYQWQSSPDEISWTNIASTTVTGITATTYFRRIATCNSIAYSNTIRVKVQTVVAQPAPGGLTAPVAGTQPLINMPSYSSGLNANNMNYIRTREFTKPGITDTAAARTETNVYAVHQVTEYVDGLGRPLQTVEKQATPALADMITTNFFDAYGRETKRYLPYTDGNSTGNFRTDASTKQPAFYNTFFNNQEGYYYTNTTYEKSLLDRVQTTTEPGHSWTGHNVGTRSFVRTNTLQDSVHIWSIDSPEESLPLDKGYYLPGSLSVMETTDEHDNKTIEFKDLEGQTILKKVQLTDALQPSYDNWLSTYYVFDDLNNQRYIIAPKAVQYLSHNNWILPKTVADELCFKYMYDKRKLLIFKKVPGAGAVSMVYDANERLVMTQDSLLKQKNQWLVTVFDVLNRPTKTVLWNNTNTASFHQNLAYTSTAYPLLSGTYVIQTETFYDDYSWQQSYTDMGAVHNFSAGFNNSTDLPGIQVDAYPLSSGAATLQTRGLVTGTRVRVMDPANAGLYLYTVKWYDDRNRELQVQSGNVSGGWDTLTVRYDFGGKVLSSCVTHNITTTAGTVKYNKLVTANNYDQSGRLVSVNKYLNGATTGTTILTHTYDELGQLKKKVLGASLENLDYTYNIRGWIRGINKDYVTTAGSTSNWFGQELSYDYGFNASQYNGNISGIKWKSKSDGIARAYGYVYDPVNRLTTAAFNQQNSGGSSWTQDKMDFSVSGITYDVNGNIGTMMQKGMIGVTPVVIDKLTYSYLTNSNKLSAVADTANTASAKLGDFINGTNTGNDYTYNGNGSLISDENKKISVITYNYLNLPDTIKIKGKGTICYIYDAAGNKQKKIVTDSTFTPVKITTTTYTGDFVYQNDSLQYIRFEEGRLRPKRIDSTAGWTIANTRYFYDYFVKDHIGNIRTVLTTQSDTSVYAATMETAAGARENALFNNIDNTRKPIQEIAGYPVDNTTSPNASVARLNASNGQKIGPSLVLRVMAGDTIQIGVKAFYKSTGTSTSGTTTSNMLTALLQAFSGAAVNEGVHNATGAGSPITTNFSSSDYEALKQKDPAQNAADKPKAYLNYALFDNGFSVVNDNSGVKQVQGSPDQLQTLGTGRMTVKETGFLYIYTSNESAEDVYFDNLIVVLNSGPLAEETHYYPFGLTMAGISNNALKGLNYPENRLKYNGIEKIVDLGLEDYDAKFRELDPQTGRWWEIDPRTDNMENWSPYASNYDNPIKYSDFLGDEPDNDPPKGLRGFLISSAGLLNGVNHFLTLNTYDIPAERFGLYGDDAKQYDFATRVGEIVPLLVGQTRQPTVIEPLPIPAGPRIPVKAIPVPATITPVVPPTSPTRNTSNQKKGPKDLVEEAKAAQQKKDDAAAREAKRKEATAKGKVKEGKSNQVVKGDHNTNTSASNSDDHAARIKRAQREQKAAQEKREAAKKKPN